MKSIDVKSKTLWGVCITGLLSVSYGLCRFVLFGMHGMKDWPNILALVGFIIIIIASIYGRRKLSLLTVAGYMGGFILAMIFNTDGIDQGGGGTNNAWIIWGCVFILSVIVGLLLERRVRVVGFISTLIFLCGVVVLLFVQAYNQFTMIAILVPIVLIIGIVLILVYRRENQVK